MFGFISIQTLVLVYYLHASTCHSTHKRMLCINQLISKDKLIQGSDGAGGIDMPGTATYSIIAHCRSTGFVYFSQCSSSSPNSRNVDAWLLRGIYFPSYRVIIRDITGVIGWLESTCYISQVRYLPIRALLSRHSVVRHAIIARFFVSD